MAALRSGFGPTLPAILRRRLGIPPRVTVAVAVVLAAAASAAIFLLQTRPPSPGEQVTHEDPPVFNLLHPEGMRVAAPRRGELMRIEGRLGDLSAEVTVRPLELPPYGGDVTHGLLPVFAERFVARQRTQTPGLRLTAEGRARVNNGVGYEVAFEARGAGGRRSGRDALLVPDEPKEGQGFVTLSLRQRSPKAKLTAPEKAFGYAARRVYRSFRFGPDRG